LFETAKAGSPFRLLFPHSFSYGLLLRLHTAKSPRAFLKMFRAFDANASGFALKRFDIFAYPHFIGYICSVKRMKKQ
jgi:hypothetical protein